MEKRGKGKELEDQERWRLKGELAKGLEDGKEKICCYWFIGLKLDMEGGKGGQLDLTTPIKVCTL